ncbi:hypothetical protein ES702_05898 [subsurface metagenome]
MDKIYLIIVTTMKAGSKDLVSVKAFKYQQMRDVVLDAYSDHGDATLEFASFECFIDNQPVYPIDES